MTTDTTTSLVADHEAAMERAYDGKITLAEFKAMYQALKDNEADVKAELNSKTKEQLLRLCGSLFVDRYKNDKKAELVEALHTEFLSSYTLGTPIQVQNIFAGGYAQRYMEAIDKIVESTTEKTLEDFAAKVAERRREHEEQVAQHLKGLENPQTYDDFRALIGQHAREKPGLTFGEYRMMLSPEHRVRFDELAAEKSRPARLTAEKARKTEVGVAGQVVDGEIIETKHTKKGHDLFVVQLAERVSREDYETLNASCKRLGGYYSSFRGAGAVPGFQFTTREAAEAFRDLAGGDKTAAQSVAEQRRDAFVDDRKQSTVERLTEMADRLEEHAEEVLGRDRKTNTQRRAGQAARAEAQANADKAFARTMRNIAAAMGAGSVKLLDRVRQKVHVELLATLVRSAKQEEIRQTTQSYSEAEKRAGEAPTSVTADYVQWPSYTAMRSDLAGFARQMLETDGLKKLGQSVMKLADDTSAAYTEFVKANIRTVCAFVSGGGRAEFGTKDAAEACIARSGYKGRMVSVQIKRGQHLVVLSPSEAIKRGIWQGDGDKRITLDPDLGDELVQKAGRINRNREKIAVPWQFETALYRRTKLKQMGIETPAELRTALREFINLREAPAAPDRVKQLERSMIGRVNDGMDFFPTPFDVADEMVEVAGIQPGMSVLEPSAGWGHIAERIRAAGVEPDVVELSSSRRELLEAKGFNVIGADFMADSTWDHIEGNVSDLYDRIVMNPPFSDRRDVHHVRFAYELLKPGGRLVALMGEGVFFGSDSVAVAFREWLEAVGGSEEKLPDGTFMDPSLPVNTGVCARMVVIDK